MKTLRALYDMIKKIYRVLSFKVLGFPIVLYAPFFMFICLWGYTFVSSSWLKILLLICSSISWFVFCCYITIWDAVERKTLSKPTVKNYFIFPWIIAIGIFGGLLFLQVFYGISQIIVNYWYVILFFLWVVSSVIWFGYFIYKAERDIKDLKVIFCKVYLIFGILQIILKQYSPFNFGLSILITTGLFIQLWFALYEQEQAEKLAQQQ